MRRLSVCLFGRRFSILILSIVITGFAVQKIEGGFLEEDREDPSAPAKLTATPVSPTQINLAWNKSEDSKSDQGKGEDKSKGKDEGKDKDKDKDKDRDNSGGVAGYL